MRKISLSVLITLLSLCLCGLFSVTLSASAETNAEGWEKRADGYYYEVDPPVMDIMEFQGGTDDGLNTNAYWYLVNYTGYIEGGSEWPAYITPAQGAARTAFNANNNSVQSYYSEYSSVENAAKQMLVAQYDWGYKYDLNSGASAGVSVSDFFRHLDFTFYLDFTDLTKGWFTYLNEGTMIEFNLNDNAIRFKQHSRPAYKNATIGGVANSHGLRYGSYGSNTVTTATYSLNDYNIDLKSLTGKHKITLLIEDRLAEGKATTDIKWDYSDGALATVKIDDVTITHTYDVLHYYCGIVGFVNYTDSTLDFYATKCNIDFDANGGSECTSAYYIGGDTVTSLPTPTYGAYTFGGWYTDDGTFENEFTAGTAINESLTLHAKWIAPESPNAEGWVFNPQDGYFYENEPYVMDLFEYHEDQSTGEQTGTDFYIVNYTGYLDNNTLKTVSRKSFSPENNSVQSYFTDTMGENAAKEILVVQYDWGIGYFKQGACWNPDYTNANTRYMDFTFNLDFTGMNDGWFTYVNDSTKITFQVADNNLIFEQKDGPNKLNYNKSSLATKFVKLSDYGINLKELTGNHKITILIEDRVLASTDEIKRETNHGAKATVMIDNVAISYMFEKMGYYAGIIGFANYTNVPLTFSTTHNFGEWTAEVPASCETAGTRGYYTCADCGKYFDANYKVITSLVIDALGHDYQEVAEVPATCEATGTAAHYTCSQCDKLFTKEGEVYSEVTAGSIVLAANGHTFGEWIAEVPATCTEAGVKAHKDCTVCSKHFDADGNEIDNLAIAANGHTFGEWIAEVPATCTTNGTLGHYTCSACLKNFDAEYAELADLTIAPAHTYGEWIEEVPATCTANGTLGHYTCSSCGKYFDAEYAELIDLTTTADHSYGEWIDEVPATCTANGTLGHYTCSTCGKYFDDEHAELTDLAIAAGHTYGEWIDEVPATETETGTKAHKDCTECGKHFDADGNEIEDLTIAKLEPAETSDTEKEDASGCLGFVNGNATIALFGIVLAAGIALVVKRRKENA